MKCINCKIDMKTEKGSYPFTTKALGNIQIPNISRYICESCGETILSKDQAEKIDSFIKKAVEIAIGNIPINNFISASEVASILKISKQALSKNKRINRGFIYFKELDGRKYYDIDSVKEFKNSGDGRIRINSGNNVDRNYSDIYERYYRDSIKIQQHIIGNVLKKVSFVSESSSNNTPLRVTPQKTISRESITEAMPGYEYSSVNTSIDAFIAKQNNESQGVR